MLLGIFLKMKSLVGVFVLVSLAVGIPLQKWFKSDDGSTYYLETENKYNWFEALHECVRKNMSLIAIDSAYKHQQVDSLVRRSIPTKPQLWLGGHDNAIDNRYEWVSTGQVFSFTNWGPGQPGRSGNMEHCIIMWHDFAWHDLNCTGYMEGFICEENQLLKQQTIELETLKESLENHNNESGKNNNFMWYINGK